MRSHLPQLAIASLIAGVIGSRAEAVFALDALAAVNRLKFGLVGDNQVKVLPAALARRESNPVQ